MFLWPNGVSAKLLVWFCAAVKMQLILKMASKNHINNFADTQFGPDYFTSLNVIPRCTAIFSQKWSFWIANQLKIVKIGDFTQKMVENIFNMGCTFTSAKNYTCNFADIPFDPSEVQFQGLSHITSAITTLKNVKFCKTKTNFRLKRNKLFFFFTDIFQKAPNSVTFCIQLALMKLFSLRHKRQLFLGHSLWNTLVHIFNVN